MYLLRRSLLIIWGFIVIVMGLTRLSGRSLAQGWELTEMTDGTYAYVNVNGQDGVRDISMYVSRGDGYRMYGGTVPSRIGVLNASVGDVACVVGGVDKTTGLQEIRGVPKDGVVRMWVRQANTGVRVPVVVAGTTLAGWVAMLGQLPIGAQGDSWLIVLCTATGGMLLVAVGIKVIVWRHG